MLLSVGRPVSLRSAQTQVSSPMLIRPQSIPEDGMNLAGEDPGSILDLEKDEFVRVDGPVEYDLFVNQVGEQLVVSGRVSVLLSLTCSKCGDFFSTTQEVSSFLRAYELTPSTDVVDVAPDMREDILLSLPNYPDCKGANPTCQEIIEKGYEVDPPVGDGRWGGLDQLNLS